MIPTMSALAGTARTISHIETDGIEAGLVGRGISVRAAMVVNPVGALRPTNPANVIAFHKSGLAWALPLDFRRLSLVQTTDQAQRAFVAFWAEVDLSLDDRAEAVIWYNATGIGQPPSQESNLVNPWVEYQGARPWVAVARVFDLDLLIPLNRPNDEHEREPDRSYRVRIHGSDVRPASGALALRSADSMIDLAHFAVLDPVAEEWTVEGSLNAGPASNLRQQMRDWPQRRSGLVVQK